MTFRPPHPKTITPADMRPGDVVLSAGTDWLDTLIRLLDQGDYTHTAYYHGVVDGVPNVVESWSEGITLDPLKNQLTQPLVDVWRFESPDGHHVGDPGWPAAPLNAAADTFVGGTYAYSELLMGGLVILFSEMPTDERAREIVRIIGAHVEHALESFLNEIEKKGRTPMTCVQVATSAYWEADPTPARRYGLEITVDGARKAPWKGAADAGASVSRLSAFREHVSEVMSRYNPAWSLGEPAGDGSITTKAGSDILPLGSCTTRDIETSRSLQFVGCLQDHR